MSAQTATQSSLADDKSKPIVLSPFLVTAETNSGYLATDSVAGTRLRTPLKDIAASISVVTPDFMQDLGATDLSRILTYTTGTEVNGIAGSYGAFSPVGDGGDNYIVRRAANPTQRVRALASADLTRNFFGTGIPMDRYNTDTVTINRGANAILFGLGSPAGIIENTTVRPQMRNRGEFEIHTDSYGSLRESLDLERVLVDGKLSARVTLLKDQTNYEQEPSYRDQKRGYAAVTYKPFKQTTIRVNAETGQLQQSLPRVDPPADAISDWFYNGQPGRQTTLVSGPNFGQTSFGAFLGDTSPNVNPQANFDHYKDTNIGAGNFFTNPGVFYSNPGIGVPSDSFVAYGDRPANQPTSGSPSLSYRFYGPALRGNLMNDKYGVALQGFVISPGITDRSIFDYRKNRIDGPNSGTLLKFDTVNIEAEQLFLDGHGGVELVYNEEKLKTDTTDAMDSYRANRIMIDPNLQTTDGRPNPNFGRPFTSSRGEAGRTRVDQRNARATAFLKHDFAEKNSSWWAKALGSHTVTGFYETDRRDSFTLSGYYAALGETFVGGGGGQTLNERAISPVVYLGPSLFGAASPAGAHIQPVTASLQLPDQISTWTYNRQNNYTWTLTPAKVLTYPNNFDQLMNSNNASLDKTKSSGVVWQANIWEELLVGTFGWRHDEVSNYTGLRTADAVFGKVSTERPTLALGARTAGSLFSQGYALNVPDRMLKRLPGRLGLTFYLNRSENFQVGGFRQDGIGRVLDPQSGATKEIGVGLRAFDGKLSFRATRYETNQINQSDGATQGVVGQFAELEKRIQSTNTPDQLRNLGYVGYNIGTPSALYSQLLSTWQMRTDSTTATGTNLSYTNPAGFTSTTKTISKGDEFELVYNPLPTWRIMLNAVSEKAILGATDPLADQLLADRLPIWSLPGIRNLVASSGWTPISYSDANITNPLLLRKLQTGTPTPELRKWHVNLVTNYTFPKRSKLDGWGIGGAVRWLDKIAIGYPVINDPVLGTISDINHPFMAKAYYTCDAWISYGRTFKIRDEAIGWKIQLNVRNVLNDNLLIPVKAFPVAIGDLKDYAIGGYRIAESRAFELTSTFTF